MHKKLILVLSLILCASAAMAQSVTYQKVKAGNRAFMNQDYTTAERLYREALEKDTNNTRILFNIADTQLAQDSIVQALETYDEVLKKNPEKLMKAMVHHNKGFIYHTAKDYEKAIEEYKAALRIVPNDDDTRYNLALCQRHMKQQQKEQEQQQQQQQEQQEQQQKDSKQKEKEEKNEQLLKMAQQAENQTRKKLQKQQPRRKSLPKNW